MDQIRYHYHSPQLKVGCCSFHNMCDGMLEMMFKYTKRFTSFLIWILLSLQMVTIYRTWRIREVHRDKGVPVHGKLPCCDCMVNSDVL